MRQQRPSGEWVVHATNRADNSDEEYRFDALIFSDKLCLLQLRSVPFCAALRKQAEALCIELNGALIW